MSLDDAVKEMDDGIIINVDVTPESKKLCIPCGYNQWRHSIHVKLTQKPRNGKANEQLIEHFSQLFGVETKSIEILSGAKGSRKCLAVKGIDRHYAVKILTECLNESE